MKFFTMGLALILPLSVFSQTTPQKPATTTPAQKPATTTTTPSRPATTAPQRPATTTGTQQTKPVTVAEATRPASTDKVDGENITELRRLEEAERGGGRPYRELFNEDEAIVAHHFSDHDIEPRFLSTLLWEVSAARREDGKLQDARGVDVYVITKEGVFLYNRQSQSLLTIAISTDKDMRKSILTPESMFAEKAPLILVYVANAKKQSRIPPGKKDFYAAMDCGIASQMAYFFCASEHLVTTTIEIDPIAVGKILQLKGGDKALLAQPVGMR
jgi:hypothetical protein